MKQFSVAIISLLLLSCAQAAPSKQENDDCEPATITGHLPAEIDEASGVAIGRRNPGILWVHNDDVPAVLFAIDSTGAIHGRVRVPGLTKVDWEDIAVAPCGQQQCVYIGDIGDNRARRNNRAVYRVPEPLLTDTITPTPERFPFHLPEHSHDAEALFVMPDGAMFIITKGRSGPITLFAFPQPAIADDDAELKPLVSFSAGLVQVPDMVTGAGATPDGRFVVVRTYSAFQLYRFENQQLTALFEHPVSLASVKEPQGEGVDLRADGVLFFVGEPGLSDLAAPIARVRCRLPAA